MEIMVVIVKQFVLDKMSLLCCTRDDTLKVLDLRMNQISTTLAWVYYNCKSVSRIWQSNENQCSITVCKSQTEVNKIHK